MLGPATSDVLHGNGCSISTGTELPGMRGKDTLEENVFL